MTMQLFDLYHHEYPSDSEWRLVTDQVMGGISTGKLMPSQYQGSHCLEMRGDVSLENNGGFVQMRFAIQQTPPESAIGIYLEAAGNQIIFGMHLRTLSLDAPWQSFRSSFRPALSWQKFFLPFSQFKAHRTEQDFLLPELRSIGLVSIGEAGPCQLFVRRMAFYQTAP